MSPAASLDATLRDALERATLRLPVLPEIALRAKRAVDDPDANALKLSQIIERDAALTVRILRLANSAMFAGLHEIRLLHQAIARLGSAMVVAIVVGAATKDTFRSPDPALRALLAAAWQRSILAALAARRIGPLATITREEGFLAGLLHAVGEPVLVDAAARLAEGGRLSSDRLRELPEAVAAHRARAGAILLRSWHLPETTILAVEHQDAPGGAPVEARTAARLTGFAASLAAHEQAPDGAEQVFEHPHGAALGLDADRIAEVRQAVRGEHAEVGAIF